MTELATKERLDHLVLTRDLRTAGARAAFFAAVRRGEFTGVIRSVYMSTPVWSRLDRHAQYRAKVTAVAALSVEQPVFSHHSAAALWRLPMIGPWPGRVHAVVPLAEGGRSSGTLVRHTVGVPADTTRIDGLLVTSLARTVVDLANP